MWISKPELIAKGIEWAISHAAKIICRAEGGSAGTPDLEAAVADAQRANIVVVSAAGNTPDAKAVDFPAAYPGVVAVGGTNEGGGHAAISVVGTQIVISGPATDIVSTYINGGYVTENGTSASTAIIAGPQPRPFQVPQPLRGRSRASTRATAVDKGPPGRDDEYGYGEVNLIGALTADVPPLTATPTQTIDNFPTSKPTIRAAHTRHSTPWFPLAAVVLALLAALAVWTAAHRANRR